MPPSCFLVNDSFLICYISYCALSPFETSLASWPDHTGAWAGSCFLSPTYMILYIPSTSGRFSLPQAIKHPIDKSESVWFKARSSGAVNSKIDDLAARFLVTSFSSKNTLPKSSQAYQSDPCHAACRVRSNVFRPPQDPHLKILFLMIPDGWQITMIWRCHRGTLSLRSIFIHGGTTTAPGPARCDSQIFFLSTLYVFSIILSPHLFCPTLHAHTSLVGAKD